VNDVERVHLNQSLFEIKLLFLFFDIELFHTFTPFHIELNTFIINNNIEIIFKIANYYVKKNDYKNAIFYLDKCLVLNPQRFECLYLSGWVYAKIRQYNKALEYYHKAQKIKQTPEAYHGIGGIYKDLRSLDLALENYEKCLIINPNYLPALNNIASSALNSASGNTFTPLAPPILISSLIPSLVVTSILMVLS
jgi:tetratricopeptide (TPR) repeat protein